MLVTKLLKFLVNLGHLVGTIVVVTPELEDLLGAKNDVDAMVVLETSGIRSELAKKYSLGRESVTVLAP